MTVINIEKDPVALTMTITSEFEAHVERVWQLWENPRQLERWWGPPTWPATVVDHDLTPGGTVNYFMTGPDGDRAAGWWRVVRVEAPHCLEFEDGFADESGNPNPAMPTMMMRVTLDARATGGTRMVIATSFSSVAHMEQLMSMRMDEGLSAALGQTDALLQS